MVAPLCDTFHTAVSTPFENARGADVRDVCVFLLPLSRSRARRLSKLFERRANVQVRSARAASAARAFHQLSFQLCGISFEWGNSLEF